MATILITGGSGLIGGTLTTALRHEGHEVRWLSRSAGTTGDVRRFAWDPAAGTVDHEALHGVDHIVHLSGAGIADKRWTEARMRELHNSRGGAARLLLKVTRRIGTRPKSFISASGIGYYGAVTTDHFFHEDDPAGTDAIARLTRDWEDAADEWNTTCRVVKLRTPMVLARHGGALARLSAPVRFGLGAALGSGLQWMPWIHLDDLVAAYVLAVGDDRMRGTYNVVADEQPRNVDLMRTVARTLRKPFFLPNVPAFALRLVFGELSTILLEGTRASNAKLLGTGFRLRHGALSPAPRDTLHGTAQ